MPRKPFRHVRHQARRHEQAHKYLKELLRRKLFRERIWDAFVWTFSLTVITVVLFFNWGRIATVTHDLFKKPPVQEPDLTTVHGYESGLLATSRINGQTADWYIRYVRQIPASGYEKGLTAVDVVGKERKNETEIREDAFLSSIVVTSDFSKGYHLTSVRKAGSLQKSILATYYLGEKTININSTIQSDAQLLQKISNALSVDVFAYLNQSASRADALDGYVNLLETLNKKAQERSADLASVVNFLTANSRAQDTTLNLTQDAFFNSLKIFNGPDAEKQLGDFIGLQQDQSEVKAKLGAYKGLKQYYDYFQPKLDNLIRAVKANRDPLIAGVKVVEIQNMTLPLIIKER